MTKDFCEQQKTCWVAAVYNLQKGLFPIYRYMYQVHVNEKMLSLIKALVPV